MCGDLPDEDLADLSRSAVRASFADGATKAGIERDVGVWLTLPRQEALPASG